MNEEQLAQLEWGSCDACGNCNYCPICGAPRTKWVGNDEVPGKHEENCPVPGWIKKIKGETE